MIPTSHCPTRRSSDLGLTTIWPFSTTARSLVACTPRIADCGGLMIGVDSIEPNTPPLEIENVPRSEEHTSELQSPCKLVCRLLPEKKKKYLYHMRRIP